MNEQMTPEREDRIVSMYGRAFVTTQQAMDNLRKGYANTDRQTLRDAVEALNRYLDEMVADGRRNAAEFVAYHSPSQSHNR